jgi:hypothetical protein
MSRNTRSALVALSLSLCCLALSAQAADKKPRIADEGSIGGEWKLAEGMKSLPVPGYPETMKERGDSVCVAIGYSIDPTGKTGDFTLLKSWSSGTNLPKDYFDPFSAAAAGALSQWAFAPRAEVAKPQRTITVATMTFRGKDKMDGTQLAANCRIENLSATISDVGNKAGRDLIRREMERDKRALDGNRSMMNNPAQGR